MSRTSSWIVMFLLVFVSQAPFAETLKARHSVELKDAAGDVQSDSKGPGKDVVKVVINSDGKNLRVKAVLKDEISHYLTKGLAGDVLTLHFDTDNNSKTGGKLFWGKSTGFEYKVGLAACIKYQNGGMACSGGLKGSEPSEFVSGYNTEKYEQGKTSSKGIHDVFWISKSPHETIKEREVGITFPYSEIGVSSGQTVRIVIEEQDSTYDEKRYFPEVLLTLK
ncbi:MAG: hypothetical protein AABY44_02490 [Nitrospirota bacterium]